MAKSPKKKPATKPVVEKEEVVVRIDGDTYRIPHADIKKAHLAPRL